MSIRLRTFGIPKNLSYNQQKNPPSPSRDSRSAFIYPQPMLHYRIMWGGLELRVRSVLSPLYEPKGPRL